MALQDRVLLVVHPDRDLDDDNGWVYGFAKLYSAPRPHPHPTRRFCVGCALIIPMIIQARGRGRVEWGLPHRGRISPEEAAWVREHLDEVQQLRSERGVPLLNPADPKTKERYGL
jgi:hypothetical protein